MQLEGSRRIPHSEKGNCRESGETITKLVSPEKGIFHINKLMFFSVWLHSRSSGARMRIFVVFLAAAAAFLAVSEAASPQDNAEVVSPKKHNLYTRVIPKSNNFVSK